MYISSYWHSFRHLKHSSYAFALSVLPHCWFRQFHTHSHCFILCNDTPRTQGQNTTGVLISCTYLNIIFPSMPTSSKRCLLFVFPEQLRNSNDSSHRTHCVPQSKQVAECKYWSKEIPRNSDATTLQFQSLYREFVRKPEVLLRQNANWLVCASAV
jgi:hypothetical protein